MYRDQNFAKAQYLNFAAAVLASTVLLVPPAMGRTSHSKKSTASGRHAEAAHSSASRHSSTHQAAARPTSTRGASSRLSSSRQSTRQLSHKEVSSAAGRHSHATIVTSSHHGAVAGTTHLVARRVKGPHGRTHIVYEPAKETVATAHHGRHQKDVVVTREIVTVAKVSPPRTRYAYPKDFFMAHPPEFDRSQLSNDVSNRISRSFHQGYADSYAARSLVRAGLVSYHPLRGGIFWRREPVKYIIMHSTETGIPLSAERVIESWSSMGIRHAGAQYVVERDGTIFQAVDPDLGTVHINIFKTLPGINNDNSIGIEMNHTGHQDYPAAQREAVIKLVAYLQERYKVADENVITHRYAQQGDHTDPVNFDWDGFIAAKNSFRNRAIAYKVRKIKDEVKDWSVAAITPESVTTTTTVTSPPVREYNFAPTPRTEASTYLQPHPAIRETAVPIYKTKTTTTTVTTTPSAVPDKETTMLLVPSHVETGDRVLTSPSRVDSLRVVPSIAPADTLPDASVPSALAPSVVAPKVVVPMVLPKNMPSLRGPIEMAPGSAPGLNIAPMPGLNAPDYSNK